MKIIDVEQNTPEWFAARAGKFTASKMDRIITPTGMQSKSADKYVTQLIAELITGESAETFKGNVYTERGHQLEQEAADYYAMLRGVELHKVGFCVTDDEIMGCSPDRYVDDDGILEIKTCIPTVMIEAIEKPDPEQSLEQDHRPQTQTCLHINSARKWIDTMLYCPGITPIISRSERNTEFIVNLVMFTNLANISLKTRLKALQEKGFMRQTK